MSLTNQNPKVSIVIPVYNGANYLAESINSALAQTYQNIEIIVVNDGSTDEGATNRVATSFGDKICYFQKENGGVASALNFGIQQMTGSYFSWLSHDDLYEKTKIEDQVSVIMSLPTGNNIIVCNSRVLFDSGIKKTGLIDKNTFKYFDIFLAIAAGVGINGCTLLIPKKALEESDGFNEDLPVTQDYDLWFRLFNKYGYNFVLLEKNLVVYRRHEEQDSVKKQQLMREAGDDLHYDILTTIKYTAFEQYFRDKKLNFKHTWENYNLYKERGYAKTSSMILKNILKYAYDNDLEMFYKIYISEIGLDNDPESVVARHGKKYSIFKRHSKLTDVDRHRIGLKYKILLDSRTDKYPIKNIPSEPDNPVSKTKIGRLSESLNQDGLYLTGEKVIRKAYKIIKKG